ncbi:MAG: hypothetical protein NTX87_02805 [Planctomycetota bacterium]|nr:hypothetical protein [Planctomycetota bacterium]
MKRNEPKTASQEVLYDVVLAAIQSRKVKAAVFTTFEFDPEFFELHVLPCICGERAWSNIPNVQRMQMADELRSLGVAVSVYYDRHAIVGGQGCTLDYEHVGLSRERGVFHAKNILILVDEPEPEAGQSLLLVTTSANLTRNGWWENVEVAQVLEVGQKRSSVRDDLLGGKGLLSTLRSMAPGAQPTEALRQVHAFLLRQAEQSGHLVTDGLVKPRFYSGQVELPQFLQEAGRIEPDLNLEIISPFFDKGDDPSALRGLLEVLRPAETRVFLPSDREGQAACSKGYYDALRKLPNVQWGSLPAAVTAWGGRREAAGGRPVHAKVYRFFCQGRYCRDICFIGSANLTDAAHSAGRERNIETGVLVELDCQDEPGWFLKPLRTTPTEFQPRPPEDTTEELACHPVTLRFDWQNRMLSYYWQTEPEAPSWAKIESQGVELFSLVDIRHDSWQRLGESEAKAVEDRLKSSALVDLVDDQARSQLLLVQETGMAYKPSMLEQFTPSEILEYWSLLTPRQRDTFLETKIRELLARKGQPPGLMLLEPRISLFDQFAGIFHAFSCLEERIRNALADGNRSEAEYRLLGRQYDSLPALVEKVSQPQRVQEDPIIAYVTLLCAVGTLETVRDSSRLDPDDGCVAFLNQPHVRPEIRKLEGQWRESLRQVRSAMHFGEGDRTEEFLEWYEKAFFRPVRLPQPTAEDSG